MTPKIRIFEANIDISIREITDQYNTPILARFDLTERVPDGIEPVKHLQGLIRTNFPRVFAALQVINESEETP